MHLIDQGQVTKWILLQFLKFIFIDRFFIKLGFQIHASNLALSANQIEAERLLANQNARKANLSAREKFSL